MATARKLPSGSWRCKAFSHYEYKDGKKIPRYVSFTSSDPSLRGKREAEKMAAEFALDKERRSRTDYTVQEALKSYFASKTNILSPTTQRGYKTLIRNAYDDILLLKTKKLTQDTIQNWANKYALDHAPKTVSNAHGLLSAALRVYEPSLKLSTTLPEKQRVKRYIPSDGDIKILLAHVAGTEWERIILLAAFGTLRRGEICALTSDDIHGNAISISKNRVRTPAGTTVKAPKTYSSTRTVIYPAFVIEKFKGIEGRLIKMHPEDISKKFPGVLKAAGLPHFRFHDLRHYSASIMHAIGIPDQYIMERGGWKSDRILKDVYRDVLEDAQQKFTDQLNEHFTEMAGAI